MDLMPVRGRPLAPLLIVLILDTLLFDVTMAAGRARTTTSTLTPDLSSELAQAIDEIFTPPYDQATTSSSNNNQPIDPIDVPDDITKSHNYPPKPDDCVCIAFYLCVNETIETNGDGVIDIRLKDDSPCKETYEKCCNKPKEPTVPTTPVVEINDENAIPNCGHWNPGGVGFRIFGSDNEAQFGEFPWMMAILKKDELNGRNMCGGSLIHPKVVLTAIHCLADKKADQLIARAGEWDTATTNEQFKHQDREVSQIIKHEKYFGGAVFNDIALVIVSKPFILSENVGTVCLPPQSYTFPSGTGCHASGWGKNTFGKTGVYQNILKKIDIPIVERDKCVDLLKRTRLGPHFHLHESFMCAGGEIGKDACKGDGGSPMMCPVEGYTERLQQAGIVAWGIGCGTTTPGVYVDVARFRLWIDHQILRLKLNPIYYDATYDSSNQAEQ